MKNFFINLFLFSLPILLFIYFIDVFISNNLRQSNKFANKEYSTWNSIIDGKLNSDVLIYGSSRAWVHFSSPMIKDSLDISTYNLGIDGHCFGLQYLRHVMLIKNNRKPKVIIVSIDMFSLQKRKDLYNSDQFLPYMLWNKDIKEATRSYKGFDGFDYVIPLIRYYGKFEAIEKAIRYYLGCLSNSKQRIRGYQGQVRSWNNDLHKAKLARKKYKVKNDPETVILFEKFIKECKQQNIKLIFAYAPEYIEGQNFVENRKDILQIYTNLSKKNHISFYDYSNDTISFQKKYFYNSTHMNKTGAELFTAKLIDTLKTSRIIKDLKM